MAFDHMTIKQARHVLLLTYVCMYVGACLKAPPNYIICGKANDCMYNKYVAKEVNTVSYIDISLKCVVINDVAGYICINVHCVDIHSLSYIAMHAMYI